MTDVRYLLIGGGLASYHAAKQIRRLDADGSILLAGEEPLPPYDRPPLSKEYLRGEKGLEALVFATREALEQEGISLALGRRVESLDPDGLVVELSDGERIRFGKALIATGGRPVVLNLPGSDLAGVHYLRNVADADAISAAAATGGRAVVIGGGFIGIEVAATLRQRGLEVTVIEALPRIWARFADERLSRFIQSYCVERGIQFLTETTIAAYNGRGKVGGVTTSSGTVLPCDLACVGVGIVPNVELAIPAGLAVDNGIVVDEFLRTSHPAIYGAGDVVNYPDPVSGRRRRVEHWGHAEYSGQIAGQNMTGAENRYDFLSYVWSDIFDLRLEFAGDETRPDAVLQRGRPEEGTFSILYLRDGRLTAFFGINASTRDLGSFRRLIQSKKDLSGREAELEDPGFNLRSLF